MDNLNITKDMLDKNEEDMSLDEKLILLKAANKKVAYEPFSNLSSSYVYDEDYMCQSRYTNSIESMDLKELEQTKLELVEAISDYDVIIEIQREEAQRCFEQGRVYDTSSLKTDRQRKQQLIVELRTIKDKIKMMKKENTKEYAVA